MQKFCFIFTQRVFVHLSLSAQAIEPKPADDIYDENLVSAFVSITLGIERMANANTMKIQVQKMTDEIESSLKVIGRKFNYSKCFFFFLYHKCILAFM